MVWRTEPCMPMPILRGISSYFWTMSSGAEDMRKAALDHFACYKDIAQCRSLYTCTSVQLATSSTASDKLYKVAEDRREMDGLTAQIGPTATGARACLIFVHSFACARRRRE